MFLMIVFFLTFNAALPLKDSRQILAFHRQAVLGLRIVLAVLNPFLMAFVYGNVWWQDSYFVNFMGVVFWLGLLPYFTFSCAFCEYN